MADRPLKADFCRAFQIKYGLSIGALFLAATVLLYLLMNRTLAGSYLENLRTLYYLEQESGFYLAIIGLLLVLFIMVLTLVALLLISHQIAGPVFRYESILGAMIEGDYPEKVATRKSDQLKPIVVSLSALNDRYRTLFERLNDLSLHRDDPAYVSAAVKALRERYPELNDPQ